MLGRGVWRARERVGIIKKGEKRKVFVAGLKFISIGDEQGKCRNCTMVQNRGEPTTVWGNPPAGGQSVATKESPSAALEKQFLFQLYFFHAYIRERNRLTQSSAQRNLRISLCEALKFQSVINKYSAAK